MSLEFLDHYAGRRSPGYAVLITGAWGVGKTHQVERALRAYRPLYVSLYGEPDIAAVHEAVLAKAAPLRATTTSGVRKFVELAKGLDGRFGAGADALGGLVLRQLRQTIDQEALIVFDDLERSRIDLDVLVGLINQYVEHHGCRVVVIADEAHLTELVAPAREKIFGQTLHVTAQLDEAFAVFLSEVSPALPETVAQAVREVFVASGIDSLRIARRLVEDVRRLLDALSPKQCANERALVRIVRQFGAWSCEIRSSRLRRHHVGVTARMVALRDSDVDSDKDSAGAVAVARYRAAGISLADGTEAPLHGDLLVEMLFDGQFDGETIRSTLAQSPLYRAASDLPPWRVLRDWRQFSAAELDDAAQRLDALLDARTEHHPGVLLHSFAQYLRLCDENLADASLPEAEVRCTQYLDAIAAELGDGAAGFASEVAFDEVAYLDADSTTRAEFRRVREHLVKAAKDGLEARLPALARAAMSSLQDGSDEFARRVVGRAPTTYDDHLVPFLHMIDAGVFVEAWLAVPVDEQFDVKSVLDERAKRQPDGNPAEATWRHAVSEECNRRAQLSDNGFEKRRRVALGRLPDDA